MNRMITTEHVENINRTPAVLLALKGATEIIEDGFGDSVLLVQWDHEAIIGYVADEPVGVITFSHTKWVRQLDVSIGYVRPEFRRMGLYRAMWSALVAEAQRRAIPVIWATPTS